MLLACPDCAVGRAARSLVISDAFVLHLVFVGLPFLVLAMVVRAIARRLDADDAAHAEAADHDR